MPPRRVPAIAVGLITMFVATLGLPPAAGAATTTRVSQRYAISATLDVASGRLDAIQVLLLTNRALRPIDHINLSVLPRAFGYLTMDQAVTVDGEPATTAWTTTTNLRLELATPLRPHATAAIRIPFRLDVGSSGGAFTARLSRDAGVISFGHWFPILSREHDGYGVGDPQVSFNADLISLELTTTAPLPRDAVACPGLVAAPETRGTRWSCRTANVRDFSFVVNPAFRLTSRRVGLVDLRVYTQTVSGARTADMAASALERLNELYGRYPWPDLVMAEVGAVGGFSMEYPRMIHLTRSKVTDAYVVNHEVAHMWFYAQLGNDQMLEPWLDEGFSDFTARWLMGIGENQCSSRPVDSPVFAWQAGRTTGGDWLSCDGYFHAVFYKSTEFLNAIRGRMGDEAFFGAIRGFLDRHRYRVASGGDLLRHFERSTSADLSPIYRGYLADYEPRRIPARARPPLRSGGL